MYTPLSSSYCKPFQIYVVKSIYPLLVHYSFESAFFKEKQFLSFLTPTSLYIYTLHLFHSCVAFTQICQFFTLKLLSVFKTPSLTVALANTYTRKKRNFIGDEYMGEAILVKREPLWTKEFVALIFANLCMF